MSQLSVAPTRVAGDAAILVVPDLESGNALAKDFEYLGDAQVPAW